ncbi:MAG: HNH endonuclease signature motif containing protein [Verrucomicrobia bacterium]|nr:HNH endonuclease signature motif containing protein [Verrucomicrobiota bacterium]
MDATLRETVRLRAGHRCEYCRLPQEVSDLRFHIEHITPRQHGGGDDTENLALACPACNLCKGPNLTGIEPTTGVIVRLFHPRRDQWSEHFAWEGVLIVGKSDVGRTTVNLLDMNDTDRTSIRDGLRAASEWP